MTDTTVVDALPQALLNALARHLESTYPAEGCALIFKTAEGRLALCPVPNQITGPAARHTYAIDPLEIIRAQAQGWSLWAICHSHCDTDVRFSVMDRHQALGPGGQPLWPGCVYGVVLVEAGRAAQVAFYGWSDAAHGFEQTQTRGLAPETIQEGSNGPQSTN